LQDKKGPATAGPFFVERSDLDGPPATISKRSFTPETPRMRDLKHSILKYLENPAAEWVLQPLEPRTEMQNQALLMLKPECFLGGPAAASGVVDIVLQGLTQFGARVAGAMALEGPVLERLGTIDRHYRQASELSRGASRLVGAEDLARMKALCGLEGDVPVLGGHEWLALHPTWTAEALDAAWFAKGPKKVRSGFYTVPFASQGAPCLLVNGFYPGQARHFTASGRQVVLALLHSDLPWRVLRREVLGDTYPEKAQAGSIRRNLLEQREALGLARVDITSNFVHLSAGPFEGAGELANFFRGLEQASFRLEESRMATFWREAGLELPRLAELVEGGAWMPGGSPRDLFGATEELDARSAAFYVAQMGT